MPDDPAAAKVSHWRSGQIRIKKKKKKSLAQAAASWLRVPLQSEVAVQTRRQP